MAVCSVCGYLLWNLGLLYITVCCMPMLSASPPPLSSKQTSNFMVIAPLLHFLYPLSQITKLGWGGGGGGNIGNILSVCLCQSAHHAIHPPVCPPIYSPIHLSLSPFACLSDFVKIIFCELLNACPVYTNIGK